VDHVVEVRHLAVLVADQREGEGRALRLLDVAGPALVGLDRVDREADELGVAPSSVVQTGVKSLGWEKRIPQLSPSQSWKLMVPSVVSAVKSGAVSPSRTAIVLLLKW
jgi:hypothetical protein